jgi:hypothetical protein
MPTKKKPTTHDKTTPDRIAAEEPVATQTESGGDPITGESGGDPITGTQLSPEAENFRRVAMEHVARQDAEEAAAAAQVAAKRELSGPWAVPQIAEIQADWPARRQPVTLSVKLEESEVVEQAHILTAALAGLDIIKSEAKSSADAYKARQEEQQNTINRSRTLIDRGTEDRSVECVWVYETAGLDAEGRVIIDSDRRTLVRLDTGEPVRHERIPEEDRQLSLFPEEPDAVNEEPVPDDSAEFADLADDPDEFAEEAAQEATAEEEAP